MSWAIMMAAVGCVGGWVARTHFDEWNQARIRDELRRRAEQWGEARMSSTQAVYKVEPARECQEMPRLHVVKASSELLDRPRHLHLVDRDRTDPWIREALQMHIWGDQDGPQGA